MLAANGLQSVKRVPQRVAETKQSRPGRDSCEYFMRSAPTGALKNVFLKGHRKSRLQVVTLRS